MMQIKQMNNEFLYYLSCTNITKITNNYYINNTHCYLHHLYHTEYKWVWNISILHSFWNSIIIFNLHISKFQTQNK